MKKSLLSLLLCVGFSSLYAQQSNLPSDKKGSQQYVQGVSTAYINEKSIDFIQLSELSAQKDQITQISIQFKGLTSIPDGLTQFKNLEVIDLSNNKISAVPTDFFKKFRKLKKVYLNKNSIPNDDIKRLQELFPSVKFYYLPSHFH